MPLSKITGAPLSDPLDSMLADIVVRIQLSPSQYERAVERYEAIAKWIERDGSPLKEKVGQFYTQGSMAIGTTIASKLIDDGHDIDVVAELILPVGSDPTVVLDLLYKTIKGELGSRYYNKTKRNSRCVTVEYSDMHLDVTPAILLPNREPFVSHIFHSKVDDQSQADQTLTTNPWGFADWFKLALPEDIAFAEAFAQRSHDWDTIILAEADTKPVPQQTGPHEKSVTTVILQLIKRWRNVRYDQRYGRKPPSVLLSKLVADSVGQGHGLFEELAWQVNQLLSEFNRCAEARKLMKVVNPRCDEDEFTDRWPASLSDQDLFVADLRDFVLKLKKLAGECNLEEMQMILEELFGETPTRDVFRYFAEQQGRRIATGTSKHIARTGRLVIGSPAVIGLRDHCRDTPPHTFFGG